MTRPLAAAVAIVLVAGIVAAATVDGADRALDAVGAERCGEELAEHVGLSPKGASARVEGESWRVSVAIDGGVLGLVLRSADGRVLEAEKIGAGGPQTLDRASRLAIFERGC